MPTLEQNGLRALKLAGIYSGYQPFSQQDKDDVLLQANGIIDAWSSRKLRSYSIREETFNLVPNKSTYTIGSGGDFDTSRPVSIEFAFTRDTGGNDYPISEVKYNEYESIFLKSTTSSYPDVYYYNPKMPQGEINFYPTPSNNYEIHLRMWYNFDSFTDMADNVQFPQGYNELFVYTLADEMCSYFGRVTPMRVLNKLDKLEHDLSTQAGVLWMPKVAVCTPSSRGGGSAIEYSTVIPKRVP